MCLQAIKLVNPTELRLDLKAAIVTTGTILSPIEQCRIESLLETGHLCKSRYYSAPVTCF